MRSVPVMLYLLAMPVAALSSEVVGCESSGIFVEDLICKDSVIFDLDQLVAERFSQALDVAAAMEAEDSGAVVDLRQEQAVFLALRGECLNTMYPRACIFGRYERREAYLVARWNLEPPVTRTVWECDGVGIQDFQTVQYETRSNSIRFEDGDSVEIGFRRLSSKGEWYVGSLGRSIVIRGATATYTRPYPKQTEHICQTAQTN